MYNLYQHTIIGQLNTIDNEISDTFEYGLISGQEDTNNSLFTIDSKNQVIFIGDDKYAEQDYYSFRVKTTDSGGESVETSFRVYIRKPSPPTDLILNLSYSQVPEKVTGISIGTFETVDQDLNEFNEVFIDTHVYTFVEDPIAIDNSRFLIVAGNS